MEIDLVYLSNSDQIPDWYLGDIHNIRKEKLEVISFLNSLIEIEKVEAILIWNDLLPLPNQENIIKLISEPVDLWHAGLLMGMAQKPEIINWIAPIWMLNRDPDSSTRATSWRLCLDACLIRTAALKQLGGPNAAYDSLEAASLELGYRYITKGARLRHEPSLLSYKGVSRTVNIKFEDQLRFVYQVFSKKWYYWALLRALMTHKIDFKNIKNLKHLKKTSIVTNNFYKLSHKVVENKQCNKKVSVLIPTLYRYPYLRRILDHLQSQTIKALEVIVIDQTPKVDRDLKIQSEFDHLRIKWIYLEKQGQSSARNAGLEVVEGDYILFLDDDDEIPNNLIEEHLKSLEIYQCDVSSGIARERNAGTLPNNFSYFRTSDVFPTNNSIIRKEILKSSGGFDLAYDKGARADADLGMRLYLTGAHMILNPNIVIGHSKAEEGGLRFHGARVHTFASSRQKIFSFNLPGVTEVYFISRYFTDNQLKEEIILRLLGTMVLKGNLVLKVLKIFIALLLMPFFILEMNKTLKRAKQMLTKYPQIKRY